MQKGRTAEVKRKTSETDITLFLNLDGSGKAEVSTGIGFLDHMLTLFSRHGLFDLSVEASGDLAVDEHHLIEDTGIVIGKAINQALGQKISIERYGHSFVPMDEALAMVCIDLGGRPFVVFDCPAESAGGIKLQVFEEFFRAISSNIAANIHIKVCYGKNGHHIIEAVFKAFARALASACAFNKRIDGQMTTKGIL